MHLGVLPSSPMSGGSLQAVNGEVKSIASVTGRAHYRFTASLERGLSSCSHSRVRGTLWDLPDTEQRLVTARSLFSPKDGSDGPRIKCPGGVPLVLLPQGRCLNISLEVPVFHGNAAGASSAWHPPWEHQDPSKQLLLC